MIVQAGTYTGAPNSVNKTVSLTTYEGYVRDATSVVNPTVTIETSVVRPYSYMYIPEFGRYYFVTGISTVVNNLISLTGTVDVAMSFKSEFLQWEAVVRRNENRYNMLLDDGVFKAYQNSKHKVIAFPRSMDDFSYILALGGNS